MTLKSLAAGLVAAATGAAGLETAEAARCVKPGKSCKSKRGKRKTCCGSAKCRGGTCKCTDNTKQCGQDCIKQSQCCKNRDCPGNQKCRSNNTCGCPGNQTRCGNRCIDKGQCCQDRECTGANAGACVGNTCQSAFAICTKGTSGVEFRPDGPDNPPLSKGSAQFSVGPDFILADQAHLRTPDFVGTPVADFTTLQYSSYVHTLGDETCLPQGPNMVLYVSNVGASGTDDGIIVSSIEREPADCDTWQSLNALNAPWWMPVGSADGFAPQNDPQPLSAFVAKWENIAVRNADSDTDCPDALGGLRIEVGEWPNGPAGQEFTANVSYLRVGVNGKTTTFRF